VWLCRKYGFQRALAVEPEPSNADLARANLQANRIPGEVIQAAVGRVDRQAYFARHNHSNRGSVADAGFPVRMVSMSTLLTLLPDDQRIDLLKVDIEGGEQELFTGDLQWLERVDAIVAEFHPEIVDYPRLIGILEGAGFRYLKPGRDPGVRMDFFLRTQRETEFAR
jgi:FkbM family methyltransferase